MSSTGSSPFIENPKFILKEDSEFNLKQTISNLQFQLSTIKTEKKLLQQDRESIVDKYEKVIVQKNEEINKLQTNFDFLYEQNKQLDSKSGNETQIWKKRTEELELKVKELTEDNNNAFQRNRGLESKYNMSVRKYEQVKSDLNYQLKANDQLEENLDNLNKEIKTLYESNDDLLGKLSQMSDQLTNKSDSQLNASLQSKNLSLQKTNNQLQLKIDQLLQQKFSIELLRQKNISLANKISHLETIEEKACKMEIENLELKTKFEDFFKIINNSVKSESEETNETTVFKFLSKFRQLQNQNLIIQDKYVQTQADLNKVKSDLLDLQTITNDELQPKISSLNEDLKLKDTQIDKLERQKLLNHKEVEYLRKSLKELDEINKKQKQESSDNKSTDQYLSNLEKLVDDYRTEIDSLQKQLLQIHSTNSQIGEKRQKINSEEYKNADYKSQIDNLKKENIQLLESIKEYENNTDNLTKKINNLEDLTSKKQELHILQLKLNPASKDQIVKQQTLDVLRKENEDLIRNFIQKENDLELIPKSVFERQENDKSNLQAKIDELFKRNNRLKEVYSQKSRDILTIISKYFGYTIEFIPSPMNPNDLSSRIKLVSKYMSKGNSSNSHLIIDIDSKNLKAYGNYEFKTLCEDLVANWIDDKGQIPCLLSALNLKIYEKYVIGK